MGQGGGYFTGFDAPTVDVGQMINYNRLGMADYKNQQDRATNQAAGAKLAQGDYQGGAAAAFQGGNLDAGMQIQRALKQKQDDELATMNRQHTAIGNLAVMADTPEKWGQSIQAARAAGMQLPAGAEDFGYRNVAISKAGMASDAIAAELRRRQEEKVGLMGVPAGQTVYDTNTGKAVFTAPKDASTANADMKFGSNLRGNEYLDHAQTQDPEATAWARDVMAGREGLPTISKANAELARRVGGIVRQADPTYYAGRFKYAQEWNAPNAETGQTNIAFNNGMGHMGRLSQLNESNYDLGRWGTVPRKNVALHVSNAPWLNDWHAAADMLAGEIVKVGVGCQGAVADREAMLSELTLQTVSQQWTRRLGSIST